jgi:hypothetical protein
MQTDSAEKPAGLPGAARAADGSVSTRDRVHSMKDNNDKTWMDLIDWSAPLTEDDLWAAIAEANGVDVSEIADGDLLDWL